MHGVVSRVGSAHRFAAAVARASVARLPATPQWSKAQYTTSSTFYGSRRSQTAVQATTAGKQPRVVTPAPRPLLGAEEAFYAESAGSFSDLGIIKTVSDSLKAAGYVKPSRVQVGRLDCC